MNSRYGTQKVAMIMPVHKNVCKNRNKATSLTGNYYYFLIVTKLISVIATPEEKNIH